jgi:hypothetical protein
MGGTSEPGLIPWFRPFPNRFQQLYFAASFLAADFLMMRTDVDVPAYAPGTEVLRSLIAISQIAQNNGCRDGKNILYVPVSGASGENLRPFHTGK